MASWPLPPGHEYTPSTPEHAMHVSCIFLGPIYSSFRYMCIVCWPLPGGGGVLATFGSGVRPCGALWRDNLWQGLPLYAYITCLGGFLEPWPFRLKCIVAQVEQICHFAFAACYHHDCLCISLRQQQWHIEIYDRILVEVAHSSLSQFSCCLDADLQDNWNDTGEDCKNSTSLSLLA